MKSFIRVCVGFIFYLLSSGVNALEPEQISIGKISKGGNGCYSSKSKAVLSGGRLFVPLTLIHSKITQSKIDRSQCSIVLPITAKPGTRLILKDHLIQGDYSLPSFSKLSVSVEVFTAGTKGEKLRLIESTEEDKLSRRFYLAGQDEIRTECGGTIQLRVNSGIHVESNVGQRTRASVDWLRLNLVEEKCL